MDAVSSTNEAFSFVDKDQNMVQSLDNKNLETHDSDVSEFEGLGSLFD